MTGRIFALLVLILACGHFAPGSEPLKPDFTKPFFEMQPVSGAVRVMTILWDPHRPTDLAPSREAIKQLMFGREHSLRGYYKENSLGKLHIANAGIYGWYDALKPADHYWAPLDEGDQDGDGWVNGHVEKWAEAVGKVDAEIDFRQYDTNHDGVLEPRELAIHIVIPQNGPFGTNRVPAGREAPEWEPLLVDGIRIPVIAESYIGAPPDLSLVAHELAHLLLNAPDEYFPFRSDSAPGPFSLMDQNWYCAHLDPFLKLRVGWARPLFITESATCRLGSVERTGQVLVLYDPACSNSEYFLIENRWPEGTYEAALPDKGLAIWHIVDDASLLGTLPAPPGCTAEEWSSIGPDDWGRRALRMVKPVLGDNSKALWDGAEGARQCALNWLDGTPSPFSLCDISPAAPFMSVSIRVD